MAKRGRPPKYLRAFAESTQENIQENTQKEATQELPSISVEIHSPPQYSPRTLQEIERGKQALKEQNPKIYVEPNRNELVQVEHKVPGFNTPGIPFTPESKFSRND